MGATRAPAGDVQGSAAHDAGNRRWVPVHDHRNAVRGTNDPVERSLRRTARISEDVCGMTGSYRRGGVAIGYPLSVGSERATIFGCSPDSPLADVWSR